MAGQSIIRFISSEELDSICRIERECFPGPEGYSRGQLSYLAFKANSVCLVDAAPEGLRGFVIVLFRKNSQVGGIETIDVSPKFRGQGIGKGLMDAAEDAIQARGKTMSRLEVSEGNKAAIGLYEKAGYKVVKRIENYYFYKHHGTRHALRMEKELISKPTGHPLVL